MQTKQKRIRGPYKPEGDIRKVISARLHPSMIDAVDSLEGARTHHIEKALEKYLEQQKIEAA